MNPVHIKYTTSFYAVGASVPSYDGTNVVDDLQKKLFKFLNRKKLLKLKINASSTDKARLVAVGAPKASAWMFPPPNGIRHPTNDTVRHAHRLRLGLKLCDSKQNRVCVCGQQLLSYTHFLSCMSIRGGGMTTRHNLVVNILWQYIQNAGGVASKRPTSVDKYSEKVVFPTNASKP